MWRCKKAGDNETERDGARTLDGAQKEGRTLSDAL
jgi:hypothetical protein